MTPLVDRRCLSWTQRVALVRHNLHAASRTGDFAFFRTLQANVFLEGADHVAILAGALDAEADQVLHGLDDLNAGMAYIHQDSYKTVYDNIRSSIGEEDGSRKAKIRVDISQQKQVAEFGIAKIVNAAIALIENQPAHCQETVATVWIIGATIVADAVQVCMTQMDKLEGMLDDFILIEYSWQTVQTAVEASVSALRGVFNLMASSDNASNNSTSPASAAAVDGGRNASISSTTSSIFKRLSMVLTHGVPTAPPSSTRSSLSFANSMSLRNSVSAACPTAVPVHVNSHPHTHHKRVSHDPDKFQHNLPAIPPTPFGVNPDVNPFDVSFKNEAPHDEFSIDHEMALDEPLPSPLDADPMHTPLGTPENCKGYGAGVMPHAFRRMSSVISPQPIAAV